MSRLEKNAPKAPGGPEQSPPPTTSPEQAPEPLRRVMTAVQEVAKQARPMERNPSSHSGGMLPRGMSNGTLTPPKFENIPVGGGQHRLRLCVPFVRFRTYCGVS